MFGNLYARALTVLAVVDSGGTSTSTPSSGGLTKRGILDDETFALPRTVLQILSIGFLFYAIFKIVEAVAKASWPRAIGYVVSAALVLFLAWNPQALLSLLDTIGGVFENLFNLITK